MAKEGEKTGALFTKESQSNSYKTSTRCEGATAMTTWLENTVRLAPGLRKTVGLIKVTREMDDEKSWREYYTVTDLVIEDEEGYMQKLPATIYANLRDLEFLSIRWTKITSLGNPKHRTNVRHLWLPQNQLRDLNGIQYFHKIQSLEISFNEIQTLPEQIQELKYLTHIAASGNMLTSLPDCISQLLNLKELLVPSNRLVSLPESLCALTSLNTLDVCKNQLTHLPEKIGCLESLEELMASENKIKTLPESICSCKSLKHLHIRKNYLTEFPKHLSRLKLLEVIHAEHNIISDFKSVMRNLKSLILDHNSLQAVPPEVCKCLKLERLSLKGNAISQLPDCLEDLKSLRVLVLTNNDITIVPEHINKMEELRHLLLDDNYIVTLPHIIHTMQKLCVLKLAQTHLEDEWATAYHKGLEGIQELSYRKSTQTTDEFGNTGDEGYSARNSNVSNYSSTTTSEPVLPESTNSVLMRKLTGHQELLSQDEEISLGEMLIKETFGKGYKSSQITHGNKPKITKKSTILSETGMSRVMMAPKPRKNYRVSGPPGSYDNNFSYRSPER